jgi:predicted transcriptional regulator
MDDLSSRFLAAFNVVEDWMRHELDSDDVQDFGTLLRQLERTNSAVHRHARELRRLARLRNLIAHNHSRERPLAVPTSLSVERAEAISIQLRSPPLLIEYATNPVELCRPSDPLGCCVKKMHDGVFSQLPIYDDQQYCGLLTAETIARWLATFFLGDGDGIVDEQTVAEVVQHQEDSENYKFMAANATVTSALSAFEEFQRRGKRLEAILITNLGRPTETLRGIVTIQDIPKLNKAIQG